MQKILESESNQEGQLDKYDRVVDMLAENSKDAPILIEIQKNNGYAYFQRMPFDIYYATYRTFMR